MLATAALSLMGPILVAADPGPTPLTGDAIRAALTFDGESNYRPVVHYDIDVRLDPQAKMLDGEARIVWENTGRRPVSDLWWHLYLNAFRNEASTLLRESGGAPRYPGQPAGNWGWTEILTASARDLSQTGTAADVRHDLMPRARFEAPDDGNRDDRTVWVTALPFTVAPGAHVEVTLQWKAQLPRVYMRTGYAGSFYMVAQWFPKLGVLQETFRPAEATGEPAWNCHQFHAFSEFFADYGSYRVRITVPDDFVVGATGRRVDPPQRAGGLATHEFFQDRVHDFAWTADRRFVVRRFTFQPPPAGDPDVAAVADQFGLEADRLGLSPVEVTMLLQPEHQAFASRYRRALELGLKWFGLWFGRYPYRTLTLVDGPRDAGGAMGMEYPTLIAGGVRWPSPPSTHSPGVVTLHELAHQFWYGLVGSNEFEEAWLDEGLTEFSGGLVHDQQYGPQTVAPRILGVPLVPWFNRFTLTSLDSARVANIFRLDDPIDQPAWSFRSGRSYSLNSYGRTELALHQLGELIGRTTVLQGLRVFQQRWRYRHPTGRDLQVAFEEVSGRSLASFFDEVFRSTATLDYAIVALTSEPIQIPAGVFERAAGSPVRHRVVSATVADATDTSTSVERYVTEVWIERRGERVVPMVVEVAFEAGGSARRPWDGARAWHRVRIDGAGRARAARLYADVPRLMDNRPSNDTMTRRTDPSVGVAWAARTLYWIQSVLQLFGGLL